MKQPMQIMNSVARSGYILVMSLMLLSSILVMVTVLATRGSLFVAFGSNQLKREQAKLLALGGIQIAISELAEAAERKQAEKKEGEKEQGPPKPPGEEEQVKALLESIVPVLNRWQFFPLKKSIDGVTGEIRIAISSEHGKINLNQIFDFEKKKFKGEDQKEGTNWKAFLEMLLKKIPPARAGENLFEGLEKYLKRRPIPLNEVTELLTIKEFAVFKDAQFYDPPTRAQKGKKVPIALTDLFTISTSTDKLQPWLFSDAMLGLLQINRAQPDEIPKREKNISMWLKQFKHTNQWKQDWDTVLKPVYQMEFNKLPKQIESFLSNTTNPTVFSVRVHATIGSVTQRLYAILERIKKSSGKRVSYAVIPRRVYWL